MAYTKKNIKNLTGGVSQQPDSERFDNQCTEQINFLSDPVKGLTKRAGTIYEQHIAPTSTEYLNAPTQNTFTHIINRSDGERLLLVVSYDSDVDAKIELFKLNEDGAANEELTIQGLSSNSHQYLLPHVTDVSQPLSAVTIADYTFIANNQVTPALTVLDSRDLSGQTGSYERPHVKRGLIHIKEGAYSSAYTVKATDHEGTVRTIIIETSHGIGAEDHRADIRTDQIAGAMHFALNNWHETQANYTSDSVGIKFGTTYYSSDPMAQYTEEDTEIRIKWNDNSDNYNWNSNGGSLRGGSNYDWATMVFNNTDHVDNGNYFTLKGCDSANTTKTFEFTTDGTPTAGRINIDIETGDMLQTIWNMVKVINQTSAAYGMAVHAYERHGWVVEIHSKVDGSVNAAARAGDITLTGGGMTGSEVTLTNFRGAVADPSSSMSTAKVRHRMWFQRELGVPANTNTGSQTWQQTGSVISWYAQYATAAEAASSKCHIEVTDSYGNTMTEVIGDTVDSVTSLPTHAPNNFSLKVEGDRDNDADDHYLKFELESNIGSNTFGIGTWKEDMKDGMSWKINAATMPHQLVKVNSTTYKFQEASWANKTVGDENSDVAPSFIGHPIRDVFHHKSRLGFLAGENVILSEVDNAYNFWRTSVMTSVDSDRIDISSSANEITFLNWAVPFANQLVVFSDNAQFLLTQGTQGLTPSTAALTLGSGYANSKNCRPVVNDSSIVFAQDKTNTSEIYEMYPTGSTDLGFEAVSISEHIPSYIEGKVVNLSASSAVSSIVAQTDADDNKLYVYNYFNSGGKKLQSSWSKYELACNHIKFGGFIDEKFHLIEGHWHGDAPETVDDCLWVLTHMSFANTDSLTHAVDCAWNVPLTNPDTGSSTMAYDAGTGLTTITAEWYISYHTNRVADKLIVFDSTTNVTYPVVAFLSDGTGSINNLVRVTGDIASNANIVLGMKYPATYEFSKQYIKRGSADGKEVSITDGRTTNKWMEIYFNDTQHLTATVAFPSYAKRTTSTKTFNGNPDNTITGVRTGEQPSETQSLRTSVAARNDLPTITLSSDTHQTVTVTGASFELMHTSRTSRTS